MLPEGIVLVEEDASASANPGRSEYGRRAVAGFNARFRGVHTTQARVYTRTVEDCHVLPGAVCTRAVAVHADVWVGVAGSVLGAWSRHMGFWCTDVHAAVFYAILVVVRNGLQCEKFLDGAIGTDL